MEAIYLIINIAIILLVTFSLGFITVLILEHNRGRN